MSDVKQAVARQFAAAAADYRTSPIHAAGIDLPQMVAAAYLTGAERVLDAGCGAGHTALTFAPHVAHVTAVDLADAMLAQGRSLAAARGLTNVEFRRADVEHLPFPDAVFDRVVTRYSAHHWPHPQAALTEFRRVLRPGGLLLLGDTVTFDDYVVDTHFQAIELLRDPSHIRDHTVAAWQAMLRDAGFTVDLPFTWEIAIDFASWVQRIGTAEQAVAMLRTLLTGAPSEVQHALRIQPDCSFTEACALLRGRID